MADERRREIVADLLTIALDEHRYAVARQMTSAIMAVRYHMTGTRPSPDQERELYWAVFDDIGEGQ